MWFLLLALPTLVGKTHYLYIVLGGPGGELGVGLATVLDSLGGNGTLVGRAMSLLRLLAIDLLEAAVISGALFFGWRTILGPTRAGPALAASVSLLLLVVIGNIVSVQEVETLLRVDLIATAIAWTRDHPDVLSNVLGPRKLLGLIGVPLWSASPLILDRVVRGRGRARARLYRTAQLAAAVVLLAGVAGITTTRTYGDVSARFRGYWSTTASHLAGLDAHTYSPLDARPVPALLEEWRRIAYPAGQPAARPQLASVGAERERRRHVILVGLETAPARYYPLGSNDPSLPTFAAMARRGLVAERHHVTGPYSTGNYYSLVTGTYTNQGSNIGDRYPLSTDSLATVLSANGYDTCMVDSYKIDWDGGDSNRRLWAMMGFTAFVDTTHDADVDQRTWESFVAKERRSFQRAVECVRSAEAAGRHAFVLVVTGIGHFPWRTPDGQERLSGQEKLLNLARTFDGLVGEMLASMRAVGLEEKTIVAVTGDHGLRYHAEFESVGQPVAHDEQAFVVPLVMQAPGLFGAPVRIPWSTSHVDVAPTLIELLGLPKHEWLQHGSSMLDPALAARVTFLPSLQLSPEDGFVWGEDTYTLNSLTGQVRVRSRASQAGRHSAGRLDDSAVRGLLERAFRLFDVTAASFAARAMRPPQAGRVQTHAN